MNNQEILEGNKLIAEFMEYKPTSKEIGEPTYTHATTDKGTVIWLSQFRYHSSWDWLMPVVDKIESLDSSICDCRVTIKRKECKIFYDDFKNHQIFTNGVYEKDKITSTHKAIIEFIKWYNSLKNKN